MYLVIVLEPVPLSAQPLSRISKVMDRWADELQVSQARLREVICRRYHSPDLQDVESGDIEDGAHLQSHEAEEYLGEFQAARWSLHRPVLSFWWFLRSSADQRPSHCSWQ